jgi:GT2 family glycosyltransferase
LGLRQAIIGTDLMITPETLARGGSAYVGGRPILTITVVLYRCAATVGACLASIADELRSGWAELVAVDNASPDASAALVGAACGQALVVRSPRNLGFAGGCNLAWPHARGRYWLLLNPDVVVPPGGLSEMVRWLDANPEVGVASPRLRGYDGCVEASPRRFPRLSYSVLELLRVHRLLGRRLGGRLLLGPHAPEDRDLLADWVPGTAMFVRRHAVEDVGLLNEAFFLYGEDVEYCWRMRRRGWRVVSPRAPTFVHGGRGSAELTWGSEHTAELSLLGWYRVCRLQKGRIYARCLLAVDALAMLIESRHPWRAESERRRAKRALSLMRRLPTADLDSAEWLR